MQGIVDGAARPGRATAARGRPRARCCALALIPLLGNQVTASRAHETMARDFACDMLQSVEPYGILITAGDNDTFPLWYAQEVEGVRPRRDARQPLADEHRVAPAPAAPARDPGVRSARRPPPIWENYPVPPRPTTPVLSLTEAEVDSLPEAMQVPAKGGVRFDSLQLSFGQDVLLRQDLATIFLIRDNIGKRPIFFSWSDGGYPDQTLGLSPYLVSRASCER